MALPAPKAKLQSISAGWKYRSGKAHAAYDYRMPIGTPIYAVQDGVIIDCNDGVKNQRPGNPAGSGAPSNWILLRIRWGNGYATVYYQHLNKGLLVKKGDRVKAGEQIAKSGNSGNTTGPHLHIAAMKGVKGRYNRYDYLANGGRNSTVIFPPSRTFPGATRKVKLRAPAYPAVGTRGFALGAKGGHVKLLQVALGQKVTGVMSAGNIAAVKRFQRARPWLWPADGKVGPKTYAALRKTKAAAARWA